MKPLKYRVTLFIVAVAVLGGGGGLFGLKTFLKIYNENQRIRQSLLLRDWVEILPSQPIKNDIIKELQSYRAELTPEARQNALSDIIQAYTAGNHRLLRKRIHTFVTNEKRYISELEPKLTNLEQQTLYFGALAIAALLAGLVTLRSFLSRNIFDHLEQLTSRMMDFLNGKYSYQFEVPPQNEVGDLQATFNSMAQRVLQNMEDLKALDIAKSEFLNIASHELRTPMTSIKGSLGLLTSGVMGEISKEPLKLLEIAEIETDRLIRLINDILDMAKIEAGKLPLKLDWVQLSEIMTTTRQGLMGLAETAQVKIQIVESPDIAVHIDRDRIQQVITNLVSNAIKFSPQKSVVKIGYAIEAPSNTVRVFVADQGQGIAPDDQRQIFEKFRQATSADSPLVKGTGLGLAIAKALVEEHNGVIGVESTPGRGSTFYFTLPQWREMEQRAAA